MSGSEHKLPAPLDPRSELERQVALKQRRRLRGQRRKRHSIWVGLGMLGLVGWAVATPILAGTALGVWIDHVWPSRFSWTLMLLMGGAILGSLNAWHWIVLERRAIERELRDANHDQ